MKAYEAIALLEKCDPQLEVTLVFGNFPVQKDFNPGPAFGYVPVFIDNAKPVTIRNNSQFGDH